MQGNFKKLNGIALAAAAMLLAAPLTLVAGDKDTAGHCNGANACKGKGFVRADSKEDCDKMGGTFEAPAAK
jgi:hypothetical protein